MVVNYRAIQGHGDLQVFDLRCPVEELPVLVRFDLVVPANASDRVAACEERITDHIAPTGFADAFVLSSMHPNPGAVHQRAKEHGPTTRALTYSKDVELVLNEPLVNSIEVQIGRYDLIIIEQENELGLRSIDGRIASYTDAHIVLVEIDHFAVLGGLGIFSREPVFRQPIINDHNFGIAKLLSQ